MHINTKSIKFKIILYSVLCTAVVGICSNLYLYTFLNKRILDKADEINQLYLNTVADLLNNNFKQIQYFSILCANNNDAAVAMNFSSFKTKSEKRAMLKAQQSLDKTANSSRIDKFINRLLIFNADDLCVQSIVGSSGSLSDLDNVRKQAAYLQRDTAEPFSILEKSISDNGEKCFTAVIPIKDLSYSNKGAYVYIEVNTQIIYEVLRPYEAIENLLVLVDNSDELFSINTPNLQIPSDINIKALSSGSVFNYGDTQYRLDSRKILNSPITLCNIIDVSAITLDKLKMIYTLLVVMASVLAVTLGITIISSNFITRPIQKLIKRIKRMSANDFSYDAEIETTPGEIGEVGKVINEMCLSFNNLLKETTDASEAKKNIEIDLLQTQVNPHFLYNTLDSIHWMAVIQKNPGICNITRSLSNLLKNMAKGFSQKIPLEEELKLLEDYVTIQSIRYMETFELINNIDKRFYKYNIVKLTLQPLVENAIFHGIEPMGVYGTITLSASEEDNYLIIYVEDSGAGMEQHEIDNIFINAKTRSKGSMNGIGVTNVNDRLRLVYGNGCGLKIESEKGKYTRVIIRILKEESEASSDVPNTIS